MARKSKSKKMPKARKTYSVSIQSSPYAYDKPCACSGAQKVDVHAHARCDPGKGTKTRRMGSRVPICKGGAAPKRISPYDRCAKKKGGGSRCGTPR